MIEPARLAQLLAEVGYQAVVAGVNTLRGGAKTVTPAAFAIAEDEATGQPSLILMPVLDLQQRFSALRQGVEKAKAQGFVFMFDGLVKGLDGTHDALLVVTCTPLTRRAQAVYYRRTDVGLEVGDSVDAPDEIAAPYQQVFHVQPQPSAPEQ